MILRYLRVVIVLILVVRNILINVGYTCSRFLDVFCHVFKVYLADPIFCYDWPDRASKGSSAGPIWIVRYLLLARKGQQKLEDPALRYITTIISMHAISH